jgi:catechol 2,3-dioxygenase-like lactoylglutathione lyase family enzyme
MAKTENKIFDIRGINHLALVCKDMARTVDFYSNVLGMPLVKTIDLPGGMGQHFFFDIGNGDCLAFFWFPNAPAAQPGISSALHLPMEGPITSAHGSMNHVAFNVPEERFDEYCEKLKARGVKVSHVLNHDESEMQTAIDHVTPTTFVRSIYFFDPDGICLEFATWTRTLDPARDATALPVDAEGHKRAVTKKMEPAE